MHNTSNLVQNKSQQQHKDSHSTEVEMLFLPSEARTRHLCSTSCPFFSIFCNCALLLRVAAPQKKQQQRIRGQTSTPQPLQSANQHATERALTSLHGDPHGSLLRAPLVHARQLAQEPIWLQDHLNKATQIRGGPNKGHGCTHLHPNFFANNRS
jgi:hypothetical protein